MSKCLNARQRDVLQSIIEDMAESGKAPTIQELQDSLGFSHYNQVVRALQSLEAKEFIARDRYKHRGITVLRVDAN